MFSPYFVVSRVTVTPPPQLFEHCLAPDTMGDGTGCDNMTAVIVKFKPGFVTLRDAATNGTATNGASARAAGEEPASKRAKLDAGSS